MNINELAPLANAARMIAYATTAHRTPSTLWYSKPDEFFKRVDLYY